MVGLVGCLQLWSFVSSGRAKKCGSAKVGRFSICIQTFIPRASSVSSSSVPHKGTLHCFRTLYFHIQIPSKIIKIVLYNFIQSSNQHAFACISSLKNILTTARCPNSRKTSKGTKTFIDSLARVHPYHPSPKMAH